MTQRLYPQLVNELKSISNSGTAQKMNDLSRSQNCRPKEGMLIDFTEECGNANLSIKASDSSTMQGTGKLENIYLPMGKSLSKMSTKTLEDISAIDELDNYPESSRGPLMAQTNPNYDGEHPSIISSKLKEGEKMVKDTGLLKNKSNIGAKNDKVSARSWNPQYLRPVAATEADKWDAGKVQKDPRIAMISPSMAKSWKRWKKIKIEGFRTTLQIGPQLCQWNLPQQTDVIYIRINKDIASEYIETSQRQNWVVAVITEKIEKPSQKNWFMIKTTGAFELELAVKLDSGKAWEFYTNIVDNKSRNSRIKRNIEPGHPHNNVELCQMERITSENKSKIDWSNYPTYAELENIIHEVYPKMRGFQVVDENCPNLCQIIVEENESDKNQEPPAPEKEPEPTLPPPGGANKDTLAEQQLSQGSDTNLTSSENVLKPGAYGHTQKGFVGSNIHMTSREEYLKTLEEIRSTDSADVSEKGRLISEIFDSSDYELILGKEGLITKVQNQERLLLDLMSRMNRNLTSPEPMNIREEFKQLDALVKQYSYDKGVLRGDIKKLESEVGKLPIGYEILIKAGYMQDMEDPLVKTALGISKKTENLLRKIDLNIPPSLGDLDREAMINEWLSPMIGQKRFEISKDDENHLVGLSTSSREGLTSSGARNYEEIVYHEKVAMGVNPILEKFGNLDVGDEDGNSVTSGFTDVSNISAQLDEEKSSQYPDSNAETIDKQWGTCYSKMKLRRSNRVNKGIPPSRYSDTAWSLQTDSTDTINKPGLLDARTNEDFENELHGKVFASCKTNRAYANRITGMFLQIPRDLLLKVLKDEQLFLQKVDEAEKIVEREINPKHGLANTWTTSTLTRVQPTSQLTDSIVCMTKQTTEGEDKAEMEVEMRRLQMQNELLTRQIQDLKLRREFGEGMMKRQEEHERLNSQGQTSGNLINETEEKSSVHEPQTTGAENVKSNDLTNLDSDDWLDELFSKDKGSGIKTVNKETFNKLKETVSVTEPLVNTSKKDEEVLGKADDRWTKIHLNDHTVENVKMLHNEQFKGEVDTYKLFKIKRLARDINTFEDVLKINLDLAKKLKNPTEGSHKRLAELGKEFKELETRHEALVGEMVSTRGQMSVKAAAEMESIFDKILNLENLLKQLRLKCTADITDAGSISHLKLIQLDTLSLEKWKGMTVYEAISKWEQLLENTCGTSHSAKQIFLEKCILSLENDTIRLDIRQNLAPKCTEDLIKYLLANYGKPAKIQSMLIRKHLLTDKSKPLSWPLTTENSEINYESAKIHLAVINSARCMIQYLDGKHGTAKADVMLSDGVLTKEYNITLASLIPSEIRSGFKLKLTNMTPRDKFEAFRALFEKLKNDAHDISTNWNTNIASNNRGRLMLATNENNDIVDGNSNKQGAMGNDKESKPWLYIADTDDYNRYLVGVFEDLIKGEPIRFRKYQKSELRTDSKNLISVKEPRRTALLTLMGHPSGCRYCLELIKQSTNKNEAVIFPHLKTFGQSGFLSRSIKFCPMLLHMTTPDKKKIFKEISFNTCKFCLSFKPKTYCYHCKFNKLNTCNVCNINYNLCECGNGIKTQDSNRNSYMTTLRKYIKNPLNNSCILGAPDSRFFCLMLRDTQNSFNKKTLDLRQGFRYSNRDVKKDKKKRKGNNTGNGRHEEKSPQSSSDNTHNASARWSRQNSSDNIPELVGNNHKVHKRSSTKNNLKKETSASGKAKLVTSEDTHMPHSVLNKEMTSGSEHKIKSSLNKLSEAITQINELINKVKVVEVPTRGDPGPIMVKSTIPPSDLHCNSPEEEPLLETFPKIALCSENSKMLFKNKEKLLENMKGEFIDKSDGQNLFLSFNISGENGSSHNFIFDTGASDCILLDSLPGKAFKASFLSKQKIEVASGKQLETKAYNIAFPLAEPPRKSRRVNKKYMITRALTMAAIINDIHLIDMAEMVNDAYIEYTRHCVKLYKTKPLYKRSDINSLYGGKISGLISSKYLNPKVIFKATNGLIFF